MIILDYKDRRPIYEQIVEKVSELILKGVLKPDEKMPSVRSLAMELSINPNTIQRAYGELERRGFLYSVKGRGNFVTYSENLIEQKQEGILNELSASMEKARMHKIDKITISELLDQIYEGGRQMIEIKNLTKKFGRMTAVDHVSFTIKEHSIFGLIGTNGAGKSTLLRMVAGILKPEEGEVILDGEPVYENPKAKEKFFFVPDEPFYFANSTPCEMKKFYMSVYPDFDKDRFEDFMVRFELGQTRKIQSFSKGMKKQLAILLAICANTKYIFFDETFDGLDPVMRQAVKGILAGDMEERGLTPIIASHNLRELEDICDHVGLLHKGGILLSKDLEEMKCNIHKIQCVIPEERKSILTERLHIVKEEQRGSLLTITAKGNEEEIKSIVKSCEPIFYEVLPLSLEEIFISETEVAGYDIKKLIF